MKVQFLCMPQFGNLYPFRVPMHPRIALPPRSYSNSDINISNVGINPTLRPQPPTGLGITIPQMSQSFWPSGPMTAPLTNMSSDPNVLGGFPFSAGNVQARFPITPTASPNVSDVNASQPLRLVVNPSNPAGGIPMKMNDTPISVQPQQFTTQEFTSPSLTPISCEILMIGSWRRILSMPQDLLCYYTLPQRVFTYQIANEGSRFKMDFPLSEITSIEYRSLDNNNCQVAIEVKDPPSFYMERNGAWSMCKDFTEGSQATRHLRHVLKGRSEIVKKQILKLVQDDPQVAKVVTIVEESINYANVQPAIHQQTQPHQQPQPQQQPQPRRSSFPKTTEKDSLSDEEVNTINMNTNKQIINRTRRCASVPVSPEQPAADSVVLAAATPAMAQNHLGLQINTTEFVHKQRMRAAGQDPSVGLNSTSPVTCSPLDGNSPPTPLDMFDNTSEMIDNSPLLTEDPFNVAQFDNNMLHDDFSTTYVNNSGLPDDFASLLAAVQNGSSVGELLDFGDGLGGGNDCMSALDSWVNGNVYC